MDHPHKIMSSDQSLSNDEFNEFDEEIEGIIDQLYGMKTSPCIW